MKGKYKQIIIIYLLYITIHPCIYTGESPSSNLNKKNLSETNRNSTGSEMDTKFIYLKDERLLIFLPKTDSDT